MVRSRVVVAAVCCVCVASAPADCDVGGRDAPVQVADRLLQVAHDAPGGRHPSASTAAKRVNPTRSDPERPGQLQEPLAGRFWISGGQAGGQICRAGRGRAAAGPPAARPASAATYIRRRLRTVDEAEAELGINTTRPGAAPPGVAGGGGHVAPRCGSPPAGHTLHHATPVWCAPSSAYKWAGGRVVRSPDQCSPPPPY